MGNKSETEYVKNSKVAAVSFGDEKALLNVETGKYLYLNETGARIWDLLEECSTVSELAAQLFGEYEIELDTVRSKIETFLKKAIEARLIKLKNK